MKSEKKAHRIPRRQFLKLVTGAVGSGALLSSAAPATLAQAPAVVGRTDKRVHLLQRSPFVVAGDKLMKQQAAEWGKANGVEVIIENLNAPDLQSRFAAAIEAKAGADVVELGNLWPWLYAPALVDVTKAAEAYQKKYGTYYPVMTQYCRVGTTWRALPHTVTATGVLYRKDLLAEVGYPEAPKTWDGWRQAGKKLKAKNCPIGLAFSHAYGDAPNSTYPFFWSWGCKEFEPDGKTVGINSKETLACLEWIAGFFKDAMDEAAFAYEDPTNNKNFLGGTISMTISSPSITIAAKKDFPEIYKGIWHAGYPAGPAGTVGCPSLFVSHGIMAYSRNREAAEAFLLWLREPKQFEDWLMAYGGNNAGPSPYFENAPVWSSDPMMTPLRDLPKTYRALGYAGPPSRAAAESMSNFIIPDMFAKACQGMAPKDAVAWAESELKKIVARG